MNGVDLDVPRFEPFFAEVEARGLFVVVYSNGTTQGERLTDSLSLNQCRRDAPGLDEFFLARIIFAASSTSSSLN